jgi:adenylate cyclase
VAGLAWPKGFFQVGRSEDSVKSVPAADLIGASSLVTRVGRRPHDRRMQLTSTLAWLVDAACESPGADRLLADLGAHLVDDGLPLAGGALTLAVPHPLIARRTWLWRAQTGEVIEALAFAPGRSLAALEITPFDHDGRRWLAGVGAGPAHEDIVGPRPDGPSLSWIGPRSFTQRETDKLRLAARFAAAPLAALSARATLLASLEAYLGRRSAGRVLAAPLRRGVGETIQAALLFADLRGFTALSECNPPTMVISALDAWFDRIAGAVHAFGGEVLKFIGDGMLAIFPVIEAPRGACNAALRAVSAAQVGMVHLDKERQQQGLPSLPFGAALHLGEMLWGNIGAADRLDFTAIGPAVNLVSRLEGLCRPLGKTVLASGALAAQTEMPLVPLGTHVLRGIATQCEVFTLPEN